jgi:cyclophilin family peptidyl-prolyl cis-trans isomerase
MKTIAVLFLSICFFFAGNAQNKKERTKIDNKKTTAGKTIAIIKTNLGNIEIELFAKETPKTVENFVTLAKKGYYNGIIFHRVIKNFMIQGGDPTGTGTGGQSAWGGKFDDEIVPSLVFDKEGILAMANAGPGTNGSQFFITLAPTTWLNGHHTIFGKVIKGMDVVKAIGNVKTAKGDKPVNAVVMKEVVIEKR